MDILKNFSGAQMVRTDDELQFAVVWKGGAELLLVDEEGYGIDVRNAMESFENHDAAYNAAGEWLQEILASYEEDYDNDVGNWHDADALASAGFGTDEDYGG